MNTAVPSRPFACAPFVAITILTLTACCAALAFSIDHWGQIWSAISGVLSLGGHFWAAVASATIVLVLSLSLICALSDNRLKKSHAKMMVVAFIVSVFIYTAAYGAMQESFADFDAISTYGKIAVVVLSLPLLFIWAGAIGAMFAVLGAFSEDYSE